MSDVTDKLFENDDLLSILSQDTDNAKESLTDSIIADMSGESMAEELNTSNDEENEIDKKFKELKDLALKSSAEIEDNQGSGDIDEDLLNWFNGEDKLPSEPLTSYVSNAMIKMEYGLTRDTLANSGLSGYLRNFLYSCRELLFDPKIAMSLTPSELEDRFRLGIASYKELYEMDRKTLMALKDYKLKSNGVDDETDKLKMMLSSIPSDKLKSILTELSK